LRAFLLVVLLQQCLTQHTAGVLLLCAPAPAAQAVDFVFASPAAVEGLRRRDEAMQFKCRGGMMDCDGDRREYARKQTANFVAKASGEPTADSSCKARTRSSSAQASHGAHCLFRAVR
jgi:hypothetical protein